jgi:hypothetical protein
LEALFTEERRCPRCGAFLHEDRRANERRSTNRRVNPSHDPGPPLAEARTKGNGATAAAGDDAPVNGGERRVATRRTGQRRGSRPRTPPAAATDSGGLHG